MRKLNRRIMYCILSFMAMIGVLYGIHVSNGDMPVPEWSAMIDDKEFLVSLERSELGSSTVQNKDIELSVHDLGKNQYDICLVNTKTKAEYQPVEYGETALVSVCMNDDKDYYVSHTSDDGKKSYPKSNRDGNKITFKTEHFSQFDIAEVVSYAGNEDKFTEINTALNNAITSSNIFYYIDDNNVLWTYSNGGSLKEWNDFTFALDEQLDTIKEVRPTSDSGKIIIDTPSNSTVTGCVFYNATYVDLSNWDVSKIYRYIPSFELSDELVGLNLSGWKLSASSHSRMFYGCSKLEELDLSGCSFYISNASQMFQGCSALKSVDISGFDLSGCTDMSKMFYGCSALTDIKLPAYTPSDYDYIADITFLSMFENCSSLESIDMSSWKLSKVSSVGRMFKGCSKLRTINLSGWDLTDAVGIFTMFEAFSVKNLDLSDWKLPTAEKGSLKELFKNYILLESLNLSNWDVSETTDMTSMFQNCRMMTTLDLTGWNPAAVTSMKTMFSGCSKIESIDVSNWDTSKVTNMYQMFYNCKALKNLDVSNWDTSSVTTMQGTFTQCSALEYLNVSNWNTSKVENFWATFSYCSALKTLDVSNWSTGAATTTMAMFSNCKALETLNVADFDMRNNTTVEHMFVYCESLQTLDMSRWSTPLLANASGAFSHCTSLKDIDLSSWTMDSNISTADMFSYCSSLTDFSFLENWNMVSTQSLNSMFEGCTSVETLSLSNWNLASAGNLMAMFMGCEKLKNVNIDGWNVSTVINLSNMFDGCSSLEYVDINTWQPTSANTIAYMFANTPSLKGIDISNWGPYLTTLTTAEHFAYNSGVYFIKLPDMTLDITKTNFVDNVQWCYTNDAYDPFDSSTSNTVTWYQNLVNDTYDIKTGEYRKTSKYIYDGLNEYRYVPLSFLAENLQDDGDNIVWYEDAELTTEFDFSLPTTTVYADEHVLYPKRIPANQLLLKTPSVKMDCYNLVLATRTPVMTDGTQRSDIVSDVKDYLYVTADTELTVSEFIDGDYNFVLYSDSMNRVLHEGTYRVFTKATYNDGTTDYESDIDYTDITVEKPILDNPGVIITEVVADGEISYVAPTRISTAEGITDYSSVVGDLKLARFVTGKIDFDKTTLLASLKESDFTATDTLGHGCNRIYALSSLTVPKSMLGQDKVTYYSEPTELMKYIKYSLSQPSITDGKGTVSIQKGSNISDSATIEFIYTDVLEDIYSALDAEHICTQSTDYTGPVNEIAGLRKVYAVNTLKETVDGIDYVSYSDVASLYTKEPYEINDVALSYESDKITLSSGGYSQALKEYDTSAIYYLVSDKKTLTDAEKKAMVCEENKYATPIDKNNGGYFLHTVEVVFSDDKNGHTMESYSNFTCTEIPTESVRVLYDGNGGTVSRKEDLKVIGKPYGELPSAERTGYGFEQWFNKDLEDNSGVVTKDTIVSLKTEHTLTAAWEPNTYIIRYNKTVDEIGDMPDTNAVYDETVSLRKNNCKKESIMTLHDPLASVSGNTVSGNTVSDNTVFTMTDVQDKTSESIPFTFKGWSRSADSTVVAFKDEADVKNLTETDGKVVDLYSVWEPGTFTFPTLEKNGYILQGWSNGSTTYSCGSTIEVPYDMEFKAMWVEVDYYTVSFDANGGTACDVVLKRNVGDEYGELPLAEKPFHNLLGWFTNTRVFQIKPEMVKATPINEILYAEWEEYDYTVTFNANGGSGEMKPLNLKYSEAQNLPVNAFKRKGYTFVGWNTDKDAKVAKYKDSDEIVSLTTQDDNNINLYAIWKKVSGGATPTPTPAVPQAPKPNPIPTPQIIINVKTSDSMYALKYGIMFLIGVGLIVSACICEEVFGKREENK